MPWLFLTLLGAAGFGLTSLIDKLFVGKFLKSEWSYYCWWGCASALASPLFLIFHTGPVSFNIFAALAGMSGAIASRAYLAAISREDISNVAPIFLMSPLFALVLSAIFLSEAITLQDCAGIAVVVFGAMLMALREPHKLKLSAGMKFALLNAAIAGANAILYKLATGLGGAFEVSFWEWLFFGIVAVPIGARHIGTAVRRIRALTLPQGALMASTIPIIMASFALFILAYSMQSAPLVAAVGASQPLFVFMYAGLASIFIPKLLKEELDRRTILFKLLGGALIIIGVFLVS